MTQNEFLEEVKAFCAKNSYRFIGRIIIGNGIIITILGDNCAEALDQFLTDLGVKHTTPCKSPDGIDSYVTL